MKVSVIIPFHKVEAYIESCIQSIIDQTYNNIELILVNDKSPDKSLHLAKEVILLNAFRDVTIIEHAENRGVSAARNTGLAAATGDFVLFVDSDDTLEPTMLEEMTNIVNKHNVDIAICNVWRIHTKDSQQQNAWKSALTGLVDSNTAVEAILDFREKAYVWKNLYIKYLFNNIRFIKNIYYEDSIIQPLLWKEARQLYFHQSHLYNYFERSGSITAKVGNLNQYLGIPDGLEEMKNSFLGDARVSGHLRASLLSFTHTWMRNLTLTIISANLPYDKVAEVLNKYSRHIKLINILKLGFSNDKRLALFLTTLKISPYYYWKRFSTHLLER